jgi:DNA repair and recombination protein RAD52
MSFSDKQVAALEAPLHRENVKSRKQGGSNVSYIEGYHAENEANRIFGFDAWDRETVDLKCVAERERKIGKGQYEKDGFGVSYIARVRVTVRAGDTTVVREGVGAGHGIDSDLGQAHESAIKEAETDAEKRALKTFGNPFGQALYDKEQTNVADAPPPVITDAQYAELTTLAQQTGADTTAMLKFYGVKALNELPAARFEHARSALTKKLKDAA